MADKTDRILATIALVVSVLAALFTGLQWWEAHKTRLEASHLTLESLHYSQRPYVVAEGQMPKRAQPVVSFKVFGNSPASNLLYEYNCWVSNDLSAVEPIPPGASSSWDLPEGRLLLPGSLISERCTLGEEYATKHSSSYVFFKGSLRYKDVFQLAHQTKFCFYAQLMESPGPMHQCDQGNSVN